MLFLLEILSKTESDLREFVPLGRCLCHSRRIRVGKVL